MYKFLAPSVLALCLAAAATPSLAIEGTLDGTVYALPDETGFATTGDMVVDPEHLQEFVDEHRKVVRPEDPSIVFMSSPRSKAAADRAVNMILMKEPPTPTEGMFAIRKAMESATFTGSVAKLDRSLFKEPGSGIRSYAVRTDLGFAPEVLVSCQQDRFDKKERCSIQLPRPDNHRLVWTGPSLSESDPEAMKAEIRELIVKGLPTEAELSAKGEPIAAPTSAQGPMGALEGTIDGTVYAAPTGSIFRTRDGNLLKASQLQAGADAERKKAGPGKKVILFTTFPVSAPATQAGMRLMATELPTPSKDDYQDFICGEGMPGEDVTCLDVSKLDAEAMPGARGYYVRFGLTSADRATVLCFDSVGDRECKVPVHRPGRILLEWSDVDLKETDLSAFKDKVRAMIAAALPRETPGKK